MALFARITLFLRQVVAELKKVVRPTRSELLTYTERRARVRRGGHGLRHRGRPGHRQAHALGLRRLTSPGAPGSDDEAAAPSPGEQPIAPARRCAPQEKAGSARVAGVAGADRRAPRR